MIPSEDSKKRLYVSTWGVGSNGISEIIGCMSFGLKHLLYSKKVNVLYCLKFLINYGARKRDVVDQKALKTVFEWFLRATNCLLETVRHYNCPLMSY